MTRFCLCVGYLLLVGGLTPPPVPPVTTRPATTQVTTSPRLEAETSARTLRLLTYNVCHCGRNLDKIAAFIQGEEPDVIFLQEVERANPKRNIASQAAQIAKALGGYSVVDAEVLGLPATQSCNTAILSKRPLTNGAVCVLKEGEHAFAVHAEMVIEDHTLHLVSVHAKSTFRLESEHVLETTNERLAQMQVLLECVRQLEGDVVVAGDFNAVSWMPEYHGLTQVLTDLGASLKRTEATFPRWRPAVRIDYIFARGEWTATSYEVRSAKWSDHKPVSAVVKWKPKPQGATTRPAERPTTRRGAAGESQCEVESLSRGLNSREQKPHRPSLGCGDRPSTWGRSAG